MPSDTSKLYGVAIGVIPKNTSHAYPSRKKMDDYGSFTVYCTPIAVTNGHRQHFEILDDYRFKAIIDLKDADQQRACFIKIVNTLEKVTALQRESCAKMNVDFRPVSLVVGDDSSKPVDGNSVQDTVFYHLFGDLFALKRKYEDAVSSGRSFSEKNVDLDSFIKACGKLPELLRQCTWKRGSFEGSKFHTNQLKLSEEKEKEEKKLIKLKLEISSGQDTDGSAHNELIHKARETGKKYAFKVINNPNRPLSKLI